MLSKELVKCKESSNNSLPNSENRKKKFGKLYLMVFTPKEFSVLFSISNKAILTAHLNPKDDTISFIIWLYGIKVIVLTRGDLTDIR